MEIVISAGNRCRDCNILANRSRLVYSLMTASFQLAVWLGGALIHVERPHARGGQEPARKPTSHTSNQISLREICFHSRALGISVGKGVADDSFLLAEGRITRVRKSAAALTQYLGSVQSRRYLIEIPFKMLKPFKCVRLVGLTNQDSGLFTSPRIKQRHLLQCFRFQ